MALHALLAASALLVNAPSPEGHTVDSPVPSHARLTQVLLAREAHARSHRIAFSERTYFRNESEPFVAGCGEFERAGEFEEWLRWDQRVEDDDAAWWGGEDPMLEGLRAEASPVISVSDGKRTLSLALGAEQEGVWSGPLWPTFQTSTRRGSLNCGLMFGERWLSEYLGDFELSASEATAEGFVFEFALPGDAKTRVAAKLTTNPDLVPLRIVSWPGTWKELEARVLELEGEGALALPLAGAIHGRSSRVDVRFDYRPSELGPDDLGFDVLPPEIARANGYAKVTNVATGKEFVLRD